MMHFKTFSFYKLLLSFFRAALFGLLLSGCFDSVDSEGTQPSIGDYITSEHFKGAKSARNVITGVEISWDQVHPSKIVNAYRIYRVQGESKTLLATLGSDANTYIHSGLISGVRYSYIVKAVDPGNEEDKNENMVSAYAWSGLNNVQASSNTSISISFPREPSGANIYIFLSGEGKGRELVAILDDAEVSQGSYTLSQWEDGELLKPGASYEVSAELCIPDYVDENDNCVLDGNTKTFTVFTESYGYDSTPTGGPAWNGIAALRAFGYSPGTQPQSTSNDPEQTMTPSEAQVELGFLPFNLPNGMLDSMYRYVVFRFGEDEVFATNTLTRACPQTFNANTSLDPCVIADNIHPTNDFSDGMYHIVDKTVAASSSVSTPPRYRYLVALKHLSEPNNEATGYVEGLAQNRLKNFSHLTPIPPKDMVLVQREAVNFEVCRIQYNIAPDPFNHNRCGSPEVGGTPYNSSPGNSALNLPSGFYDFGYNLFVDRYPLACKTQEAFPYDASMNSYAEDGLYNGFDLTAENNTAANVAYSVYGNGSSRHASNCLYKDSINDRWLSIADIVQSEGENAKDILGEMLTSSPDENSNFKVYPKFSYPYWTSEMADYACSAFETPGYGNKRIPRMREFRAFTAPALTRTVGSDILKDFYYDELTQATTSQSRDQHSCLRSSPSTGSRPSQILDIFNTQNNPDHFTSYTGGGPNIYSIGSQSTARCMSRYGVADVLENPIAGGNNNRFSRSGLWAAFYPLSDRFYYDSPSSTLFGIPSPIDSGNIDVSYAIAGGQTGYRMEIASTGSVFTTSSSQRFAVALGLLALTNEQGSGVYANNRSQSSNYGFEALLISPTRNRVDGYFASAASRYSTGFIADRGYGSVTDDVYNSRVRCVLSAD